MGPEGPRAVVVLEGQMDMCPEGETPGKIALETVPHAAGPARGQEGCLSRGAGRQAVLAGSSGGPFLQDTGLLPGVCEQQKQDAVLTCTQDPWLWQGMAQSAMQGSSVEFKPPSRPTPKLCGQHFLLPPHP